MSTSSGHRSSVACGRSPALHQAGRRSHHTEERKSVMTDPTGRNGVKTLGIKLPSELHAQFALVAQLDELNLGDAVLRAVELYVQTKRSEPDFAARAAAALEEIEREAKSRRDAIEGLFGAEAAPGKPAGRSKKAEPQG